MKPGTFKSVLSVAAVCLVSAGIVAPAQAQGQRADTPVVVNNTTANPVPVAGQVGIAGQVAIGSLPPVDAKQSGVWTVGIAGTPTVAVDRRLNYQRVETVTWSGQPSEAFTTNYTDKFSKLRVCVAHTGPNPIQVNVFSYIYDGTNGAYFTYDAFVIGSPNTVCKVYELPGSATQVLLSNTGNNTSGIARLALVGY